LELGATLRLLCRQWLDGYVVDNPQILARQCRLSTAEMEMAWPILSQFFPVIESGKRANRFMWIERQAVMADFETRRDAGRAAAQRRWDAKKASSRGEGDEIHDGDTSPNGSPNAGPNATPNADGIADPIQDNTTLHYTTLQKNIHRLLRRPTLTRKLSS